MELNADTSAIITGGASGLGAATARALAETGVRIALFDRDADLGEALASELGGVFCQADVTDHDAIFNAFAKARRANGQERIFVNCAGTGIAQKTASRDKKTGDIRPHDLEHFDRIIQINLVGTFRCTALAAAGMMTLAPIAPDDGRGVIISTASVAAEDGQIGQAAYAASKGGITAMTLPVARDLAREGIRAVTILPGLFDTPLMAGAPENVKLALGAQVPFPSRLGHPPEYASLALEICRNDMLNGVCIRLDGAIRMAPR